jgi:hypothetical protein
MSIVVVGALAATTIGFFLVEPLLPIRLLLTATLIAALYLWVAGRDQVLVALLAMYMANASLLSLLLAQVIPVWVVFPLLFVTGSIFFLWLHRAPGVQSYERRQQELLYGLGAGLLTVELTWFLSVWPFDPRSKAALTTMFFYALFLAVKLAGRDQLRPQELVLPAALLLGAFAVVARLADWQF